MTAGSDGKQLDDNRAVSSVLDQIFPLRGDANRGRQMQQTWRAFGEEMAGAVAAALAGGRSPPEIAYAIGEIVHNYFRTRGVTLTSYELRRLVAELLVQQDRNRTPPTGRASAEGPLVRFAGERADGETSWTGDEHAGAEPGVPDAAFESPPSTLVTVTPRDADAALLADVADKVRARLAAGPAVQARQVVADAIDAVLAEAVPGEPHGRHRLARLVLSELCGLGPIDRLWADRSVRAVFVNGPAWIFVERNGVLEPAQEKFRDRAQLEEVVGRLVRRPDSGAALVHLRDGSEGVVLFPPAAPDGPIVALRRGEPGDATFERLIAAGKLDRPIADLLRIATRSRLNVAVVGPVGAGKTALLAAIARDLGDARIVTLARHRSFAWTSPSKVELMVSPQAPFATVLAAGARLRPDLLLVDSLRPADTPILKKLLALGMRGVVVAGEPQAVASAASATVDIVVRLAPLASGLFVVASVEDATGTPLFAHEAGGFHRRTVQPSVEPSFAEAVRKAGYGEALASVLR